MSIHSLFEGKYIPVPESGCWLWEGAMDKDGYGLLRGIVKAERAHRVSWTLHRGDLPKDLSVLHKCDVPSCVNPNHLFLGTQEDNMRDCAEKGRIKSRCGEKHHKTYLSENQVIAIIKSSDTFSVLAKQYKMSTSAIRNIKRGRRWVYLHNRITKGEQPSTQ